MLRRSDEQSDGENVAFDPIVSLCRRYKRVRVLRCNRILTKNSK